MDGGLSWRPRTFSDLMTVLSSADTALGWETLLHRAQAWGVASYLYVPLALTCELSGVRVLTSALTALQPSDFDARLLGRARDELLEAPSTLPRPASAVGRGAPGAVGCCRAPGVVPSGAGAALYCCPHGHETVWLLPTAPLGPGLAVWAGALAIGPA
jgi:hypothetical protein